MGAVTIDLPAELLALLGSEEEAKRGAKVALILDLVRRGKLSRAKAAELMQMPLWGLPELLAQRKKRGRGCFRRLPTMPDFLGEGLKTP